MSEVEFENEYKIPTRAEKPKKSIAGFLINKGIVKDMKQANLVLLVVIITCSFLIVVFYPINSTPKIKAPKGYTIIESPDHPPKLSEPLI